MSKENRRYWLHSGSYTLLERVASLIFGFGSVFLLVRAVSKEDFGVWALFLAVTAFIEVARNGLIQNALIKYIASEGEEEHEQIVTASFYLNIGLTILSVLLLVVLAGPLATAWNAPYLQGMMYIYCITTVLLIPFSQFNFLQQAHLQFKGIFWSNVVRQGGLFFFILFCIVGQVDIQIAQLPIVQAVSAFLGAVVAYGFAKPYVSLKSSPSMQWIKKLFHFGKYVFGTNIGAMLYKNIDKWMLGSMLGTASVAIYDIAARITLLIEVPTSTMATIVFPQSARESAKEGPDGVKRLYEKSVAVVMALIIPCVMAAILFPKLIITVIAGKDYYDAIPILQLTALYGLFIPFTRQFGTALDSMGKPKVNFLMVITGAVVNVIFNYLFIKQYAVLGAAYGTLISFSVMFVLNQIVLSKVLNIRLLSVWRYVARLYWGVLTKGRNFKGI